MKRFLLASLLFAAAACASAGSPAVPGNSIYQVASVLADQDGHSFKLGDLHGKPVLVSMFYNSCQFVCPMLIDTVRMTEQSLTPQERAGLSTLLVTFDPAHDDVKALKTIATQRELDPKRWTLARTDAASVRKIAATLDIQYRLLSNGEYNHTTVLVLLDGEGRVVGRTKKMGAVDQGFVELIRRTVH